MASIRQFPATHPLPDWRNFGVMLRVLLGGNLVTLVVAYAQGGAGLGWLARYVELAALVEPVLLFSLGGLAAARNVLWRWSLRWAQAVIVLGVVLLSGLAVRYGQALNLVPADAASRAIVLCAIGAAVLLFYFELRARAFSPAMAEARLAALNARIRPHFLFNSLNAVLSLIREQPRQAEAALESLADLFRAALHDPAQWVTLGEEIELGKQYLALEGLRLGPRLAVDWQIRDVLLSQPIPPLLLQPLLENAVRHGIEPLPEGGVIRIELFGQGDELHVTLANPVAAQVPDSADGHHMALENIRERLALYYDLEARLDIRRSATDYVLHIVLPCRQHRRSVS